jgi:hypothetical protein
MEWEGEAPAEPVGADGSAGASPSQLGVPLTAQDLTNAAITKDWWAQPTLLDDHALLQDQVAVERRFAGRHDRVGLLCPLVKSETLDLL